MTCAGADCCRPYRRHWKRLARLHSVTDGGCRVRGVAYLHDRIYVIYSGCRTIGVYDGRQPFEPLDSICLPEARSFARYKFVTKTLVTLSRLGGRPLRTLMVWKGCVRSLVGRERAVAGPVRS